MSNSIGLLKNFVIGFSVAISVVFTAASFAQDTAIPALVQTRLPGGEQVSYAIPVVPGSAINVAFDLNRLSVSISGSIQRSFKIFKNDGGALVALECSRGLLGIVTGTVTCLDVLPGTLLYFVREDFVPAFTAQFAAQTGGDDFDTGFFVGDDEYDFGNGDFGDFTFDGDDEYDFDGGDNGYGFDVFDDFGDSGDFLIGGADFGEEIGEGGLFDAFSDFGFEEDLTFSEDFGAGEEFVFEGGFEEGGAVEELGFFDQVSDFLDFGGEEEEEFVTEIPEDEFGFEDEEFGFDGEFPEGDFLGEELEFGEAFTEEEQPGFFRRAWNGIKRAFSRAGEWVSGVFRRDDAESKVEAEFDSGEFPEGEFEFDSESFGGFNEGFMDESFTEEEFQFEEDSALPPSSFDDAAPQQSATVNSAFQNFINGLNQ